MNRILYWLAGRLPARVINYGETPYLERYYLFTVLGWRFYLHRFVGSDPDRGLHDHPWPLAFSLILVGWYWEQTRSGLHRVRWFNALVGDSFHRVILPCRRGCPGECRLYHAPRSVWTLFAHRVRKSKTWGFITEADDMGFQVFRPYTYSREGRQTDWWLTAPKGRDVGRMPL